MIQHAQRIFQSWNKKRPLLVGALAASRLYVAEWTGLEPATPGVTGRWRDQATARVCGPFAIPKTEKSMQQRRALRGCYSKVFGPEKCVETTAEAVSEAFTVVNKSVDVRKHFRLHYRCVQRMEGA